MNGLSDSIAMIGRNLRHIPRVPEKLAAATFMPLVFVIMFGYLFGSAISVPGGGYREFLMAGIFTQFMVLGAATTAVGVAEDLGHGLVDRFRSLPMARSAVLVGRTVADLLLSVLSCVVMAAAGLVLGWRIHEGLLSALAGFALLLLLGYALSWVGALLGLAVRNPEAANSIAFGILMPLTFLSNAFIPLNNLPEWLRTAAEWNPVSVVVAACRQLFGNPGIATSNAWPTHHPIPLAFAACALILAISVPLAVRAYRKAAIR